MGWLARKYGMAADSLIDIKLVTGEGQLVHANAHQNSDLFWGLRGGGGNFGVVTSLEFRLFPVSTVYAGNLYYPVEMAREVMARYRDWVADLPDELTTSVLMMNFPPLPELPPLMSGKSFVIVRGCYVGPVEQGEALISCWRSWQAPSIDDFKAIPFSQAASISDDPLDPMPVFAIGAWISELADEAIDRIVHFGVEARNGLPLVFIEARRRTMQAYSPEAFRRLQALKMKYDPQNVFRFSFDLVGLDR